MKHTPKTQFDRPTPGTASPPLSMPAVIREAKSLVADMTGLVPDSIAQCQKAEDGSWTVVVDVIESPARMGDNDLLAAYQVHFGAGGDMTAFERLRRYHREDQI